MRFLNTRTGKFQWVDDPRSVRYAILSHVWAKESDPGFSPFVPEQTYKDVCRIQQTKSKKPILARLSGKIRRFCEAALKDGFELGWVDSCCIDQSSSAELSEAINSMYSWYSYAGACYAFLHDVKGIETWEQFRASKWFKRGWTLQELIAPMVLVFLSSDWQIINSKHALAPLLEEVTGIESAVLTFSRPLEEVSVARRMSWAASRKTTREEDQAYSLMGIFGVNMPVTYGEGRSAFTRLQEEILKQNPDQSIFAWGPFLSDYSFTFSKPSAAAASTPSISSPVPASSFSKQYLLASSPKDFAASSRLTHLSREGFAEMLGLSADSDDAYQLFPTTAHGIRDRFPLVAVQPSQDINHPTHIALLACKDARGRLLALLLRPHVQTSRTRYFVGTIVGRIRDFVNSDEPYSTSTLWSHYFRAVFLTPQQVQSLRGFVEMTNLYISYRASNIATSLERDASIHAALREARESYEIRLSGWSRTLLRIQQYRVAPGCNPVDVLLPERILSRTLSSTASGIVISGPEEQINIQVGRCSCDFGTYNGVLGVLVSSPNATCSLEDRFADELHLMKHPVHISSWSFLRGAASKEVELKYQTGKRLTLRLTFTREASNPSGTRTPAYRLGVEMCQRVPAKQPAALRQSTHPLPARPPPQLQISRSRSNSTPIMPRFIITEATRLEESPESDVFNPAPRSNGSGGSQTLQVGDSDRPPSSRSGSSRQSDASQNENGFPRYTQIPFVVRPFDSRSSQDMRDNNFPNLGTYDHPPNRGWESAERDSSDVGIYAPRRIQVSTDASGAPPSATSGRILAPALTASARSRNRSASTPGPAPSSSNRPQPSRQVSQAGLGIQGPRTETIHTPSVGPGEQAMRRTDDKKKSGFRRWKGSQLFHLRKDSS